MAGTGLALGNDELLIVGGADGSLFDQADVLKDQHPGFPQLYSYDCEGDRWTGIGGLPANHVTTVAVQWQDSIVIPTGEIRPRVRTPAVLRGFRTPVKEAGAPSMMDDKETVGDSIQSTIQQEFTAITIKKDYSKMSCHFR